MTFTKDAIITLLKQNKECLLNKDLSHVRYDLDCIDDHLIIFHDILSKENAEKEEMKDKLIKIGYNLKKIRYTKNPVTQSVIRDIVINQLTELYFTFIEHQV